MLARSGEAFDYMMASGQVQGGGIHNPNTLLSDDKKRRRMSYDMHYGPQLLFVRVPTRKKYTDNLTFPNASDTNGTLNLVHRRSLQICEIYFGAVHVQGFRSKTGYIVASNFVVHSIVSDDT